MILPLPYLGNIQYYKYCFVATDVTLDVHEPFQKQTYRSRCEIVGANGKQTLSVPVIRPSGNQTLVQEVEISNAENWRKDHLKALESSYSRTPYFEYYFDGIKKLIETDYKLLWELNQDLHLYLSDKIGLDTQYSLSAKQSSLNDQDYRKEFSSKTASAFNCHRYIQPFEERHGFVPNLSVIDLLFNEGPNSITILQESE